MKRKKVYLLSGIPASGKSSLARKNSEPGVDWVSRDNIRFSLIKDNDNYFAKEDEVFRKFIQKINKSLESESVHTIYIDATHLNEKSRSKTVRRIDMDNVEEMNCIYFTTPFDVCLERNSLRPGRQCVPESAMYSMKNSFSIPTYAEGFDYIYTADENGEVKKVDE